SETQGHRFADVLAQRRESVAVHLLRIHSGFVFVARDARENRDGTELAVGKARDRGARDAQLLLRFAGDAVDAQGAGEVAFAAYFYKWDARIGIALILRNDDRHFDRRPVARISGRRPVAA